MADIVFGNSIETAFWILLFVNIVFVIIFVLFWRYIRHLQDGVDVVEAALEDASKQLAHAGEQLQTVAKSIYATYMAQERSVEKSVQDGEKADADSSVPSREEILRLLERGYDFRQVADRLGISVDHVRLVSRIHGEAPEGRK